jgi:hypothetical protein
MGKTRPSSEGDVDAVMRSMDFRMEKRTAGGTARERLPT